MSLRGGTRPAHPRSREHERPRRYPARGLQACPRATQWNRPPSRSRGSFRCGEGSKGNRPSHLAEPQPPLGKRGPNPADGSKLRRESRAFLLLPLADATPVPLADATPGQTFLDEQREILKMPEVPLSAVYD